MEGGKWPQSDFVIVNMDGSRHPLPLTTVYHNLQPVSASPYTFLQALFGHEYPVSLKTINGILGLWKKRKKKLFHLEAERSIIPSSGVTFIWVLNIIHSDSSILCCI